jgi:hypothetical protein
MIIPKANTPLILTSAASGLFNIKCRICLIVYFTGNWTRFVKHVFASIVMHMSNSMLLVMHATRTPAFILCYTTRYPRQVT